MIFCILLGVVYAIILYLRDKRFTEHQNWKIWGLGFLRFLAVSSISFLLLGPLLKVNNQQVKDPVVVLMQDNSESLNKEQSILPSLKEKLSNAYQTDAFHFSTTIESELTDTLNGATTNLSSVFSFIDETYANQNLGAVVIETDGIFNEGSNPIYQNIGFTAPVYFIAKGDTTQKKDVKITQVYHNNIAYLGDKFIVNVDVSAYNFSAASTSIVLKKLGPNPKTIDTQKININKKNYFTTVSFEVPADETGVIPYQIQVNSLRDEFSIVNNTRKFYVDILDARQKILILANAPHPDLAAIKKSISTNKNYEVDVAMVSKLEKVISSFDLVIFHNLPSDTYNIDEELNVLKSRNIPQLFIAGSQINTSKFNQLQDVVTISANTDSDNIVQATTVDDFKLWEQSDELKSLVKYFPPLTTKFGKFNAGANSTPLFNQRIGDLDTDYPLWLVYNQSGVKQAVIAGEGLWNWRLFNYLQHKRFDEFDELIGKTVQYITLKEDKRKFKVSASNNLYQSYDRVVFTAELYNDSYEKVNESDVQLTVKNQGGQSYEFTFSKVNDYYEFDAGTFPPGNYTFSGNTSYNGKPLNSSGKFSVQDVKLELSNTTADHNVLRNIVAKMGGDVFYEQDAERLFEKISQTKNLKPIVYNSQKTESALNLKWILFLLVGLLILEWFLRRLMGNY